MPGLDGAERESPPRLSLPALTVMSARQQQTVEQSTFGVLAKILANQVGSLSVELADLIAYFDESRIDPSVNVLGIADVEDRPGPLALQVFGANSHQFSLNVQGLPRPHQSLRGNALYEATTELWESTYPGLVGPWDPDNIVLHPDDASLWISRADIEIPDDFEAPGVRTERISQLLSSFGGQQVAFGQWMVRPRLPDGSEVSELTAWLMLLYALSEIARYAPNLWRNYLNIDRSPDAAGLEDLLVRAQEEVPRAIVWSMSKAFR